METIKNTLPLNWGLMSNPVNWVIIILMILIAGFSLALIFGETDAS